MSRAPRAAAAPATAPFTGRTLGRCRIGKPLGKGATATVYRATYLPLKREVAVKILRSDAGDSPEVRARFVEEARSLARLDHPNVVKVFDVVEDEGFLLIIMELVEGRNLRQIVEEEGPLDPEEAVGIAKQVAEALDHAHGQRILHRDVKPGNVIAGDDGKAVLVDFGNADVVGEAADRKGTAHYVAPEVFQGKHQDERTDTYSLGATLFHLLAGRPPHDGASVREILDAHAAGKIRAPSQVNPEAGIPKELDTLVKRAMAPARGYRLLAKDMAAALEESLAAVRSGPRRVRPRRATARGRAAARSGPPVAAFFVLGVVVLGGIAVALAMSGGSGKPAAPPSTGPAPAAPAVAPKEAAPATLRDGIPDAGIDKRAESRAAREKDADAAFRAANDFAEANPGKPKEIAAKFRAVAKEYADLAVGRTAADAERLWGEKATGDSDRAEREAEIRALEAKEKEIRDRALRETAEAAARMRFADALAALDSAAPPPAERDAWKRRRERLALLADFAAGLAADLEGSSVPGSRLAAGTVKAGEKVVGADADGIVVDGMGAARHVAWSDLAPAQVLALARQVMRSSGENRLLLAAYCVEAGLPAEARKEMDAALLTDRTGTVSGRIDDLFGPEESR